MSQVITSTEKPVPVPASVEVALKQVLEEKSIGFVSIPDRTHLFQQAANLAGELKSNYDQFVIIGIGGSSMGARALVEISESPIPIHFLDNVDAAEFERVWKCISASNPKLRRTAFLVVSKSGSTIEILWNYSMLESLCKEQQINLHQQSYFISDLGGNPLSNLARSHKRPLLEVPSDIGGRYSVLTPVGLVVAGICGFDLEQLRLGAQQSLREKDAVTQAAQHYLLSFARKEDITLFWFYHSRYRWLGAWIQQLWAESLGKMHNLAGQPAPHFSTPMSAIGACDQHSILQQVAHGVKNKFVCFFSFKSATESSLSLQTSPFAETEFAIGKNYGELIRQQALATAEALRQNNVSAMSYFIDDSNRSFSLGYLFMYFQLIVATLGTHEKINPFDQPGVTLGKELTLKFLQKNQ
jgi:glucose-6-phosphate isomerase